MAQGVIPPGLTGGMGDNDWESMRQRVAKLEQELEAERRKNAEGAARNGAGEVGELPMALSEFEETMRRLVQRTAMIVQAEKCVILVRDRETGGLVARAPAFGMTDDEVKLYRVPRETGIAGDVFRTGEAAIFHNLDEDGRILKTLFEKLRIRNGVTVPLIIEKRDEQNHVVDRITVGVLHCFNKRYGGEFIEEDVRLLERLSRSAAAVIANAQMFQEVVEEKQKLVHTLESLTAGLLLINSHGYISQMNAQARTMFNVSAHANPIGKPLEEIVKQEDCLEILKRKMTEMTTPPKAAEEDAEAPPKKPDEVSINDENDEEYIYQVHAAGVRDDKDDPIGTVVIFNDVTDIRNVERMKTEFVSIVSHELRTPLTPMKGFVRMLLDDPTEEMFSVEDRNEFHQIIEENVDRLGRLINDLLNVSRIEKMGAAGIEMNWEEVDIRKAAEEVVSIQKGRTDKHTLAIDFEPEQFEVETDPDKIQNILQNFVSNAIKYSPDGGEVRIIGRVNVPKRPLEPADALLEKGIETVLIGVSDQGMGIPEHALKKLGEKFYRVDNKSTRKVGGTGIGLFLVKNLIARHNGYMWIESEVGKGSTFWFRFPRKQPQEETAASK